MKRARKGREGPYSSFPRMELGSQGNAGKENIGPRSSDSPASAEHTWLANRHIAEHLQSLMLLTIRLIELRQDDATLDEDVKSDIVNVDTALGKEDIGTVSDVSIDNEIIVNDAEDAPKAHLFTQKKTHQPEEDDLTADEPSQPTIHISCDDHLLSRKIITEKDTCSEKVTSWLCSLA